ncbi:MAG TPA: cyclase family protein [Acidimicrobiales bacterium]|nr:cyclase family protein [Acidimicrobiales bacterium]
MPLPDAFFELARKVNNWGRWGTDDELGTLNLITPEAVRGAAGLVRRGRVFSLALPLGPDGPQIGAIPGRLNPLRTMLTVNRPVFDPDGFRTSDDVVVMGLQAATHWDALAHASYLGRIYNGHPIESLSEAGAARCGIGNVGRLVGRGVLLDVARAKGMERLDVPYAITGDDLDAACELGRVTVGPGDVVLVRTGLMQLLRAGDKQGYHGPTGPSFWSVEWFRDHDVAAVATDNITFEYLDMARHPDLPLVVHLLHLVEMGLTQGQNFDLEALADDCADDGVYEFLFEGSPEPFVNGLGAPVNPIVVK